MEAVTGSNLAWSTLVGLGPAEVCRRARASCDASCAEQLATDVVWSTAMTGVLLLLAEKW